MSTSASNCADNWLSLAGKDVISSLPFTLQATARYGVCSKPAGSYRRDGTLSRSMSNRAKVLCMGGLR